MKFTKRIATTALAGAMAMSMAVPAFAAANETKITAKYAEVKIDVVVPTTGTATINPYALSVAVKKSTDATVDIEKQQIVSMPLAIVNKSKMKLNVGATVTSTETGAFKFTDEDISDTAAETGNKAYVYLDAKTTTFTQTDMVDGKLDQDKLIDEFAKWQKGSQTMESGGIALAVKDGSDIVLTNKADATSAPLIQLNPGAANTAGEIEVKSGGIAMFRLAGSVAKSPTTAWKTTDGFTTTIAFTFEPDLS